MRVLLRKDQSFVWNKEINASFEAVKEFFTQDRLGHMFDPALPVVVTTDAPAYGLGSVLQQVQGNMYRTVAFASRTLPQQERKYSMMINHHHHHHKYSVVEREALAGLWACKHWHVYLWGCAFLLRTDHQALVTLLTTTGTGRQPLRLARWTECLLRYNFTVQYKRGAENQIADALSRLPLLAKNVEDEIVAEVGNCISKEEFQATVKEDPTLQGVIHFVVGQWPHKKALPASVLPFHQVKYELSVVDDLLLRGDRVVVPATLTANSIELAHESHPGIVWMKQRLRECYWWPQMDQQVQNTIRSCPVCQSADKTAKVAATPLQPVPFP